MKERYATHASFGLKSDTLDPDGVILALGVAPTTAWRKGDPFNTISGRHSRNTGIWRLSTTGNLGSSDITPHIETLLSQLEPKKEKLIVVKREMAAIANINLWWKGESPTDGYSLPSSLMERLCGLCDRLDFVFLFDEAYWSEGESDSEKEVK